MLVNVNKPRNHVTAPNNLREAFIVSRARVAVKQDRTDKPGLLLVSQNLPDKESDIQAKSIRTTWDWAGKSSTRAVGVPRVRKRHPEIRQTSARRESVRRQSCRIHRITVQTINGSPAFLTYSRYSDFHSWRASISRRPRLVSV